MVAHDLICHYASTPPSLTTQLIFQEKAPKRLSVLSSFRVSDVMPEVAWHTSHSHSFFKFHHHLLSARSSAFSVQPEDKLIFQSHEIGGVGRIHLPVSVYTSGHPLVFIYFNSAPLSAHKAFTEYLFGGDCDGEVTLFEPI